MATVQHATDLSTKMVQCLSRQNISAVLVNANAAICLQCHSVDFIVVLKRAGVDCHLPLSCQLTPVARLMPTLLRSVIIHTRSEVVVKLFLYNWPLGCVLSAESADQPYKRFCFLWSGCLGALGHVR
jgi:hypothetical protein